MPSLIPIFIIFHGSTSRRCLATLRLRGLQGVLLGDAILLRREITGWAMHPETVTSGDFDGILMD